MEKEIDTEKDLELDNLLDDEPKSKWAAKASVFINLEEFRSVKRSTKETDA